MPEDGGREDEGSGGSDDGGRRAAPRSFWSGTISFGLVSVPVDLYPANRSRRVSLRMLDEDGTPLRRRYYCPEDEREVRSEEIVRGYEVDEGEYVIVSDDELEKLQPRKSRDIDLRRFVDRSEIDPIYFQRGYFLAPGGDSVKAYRLLAATMERTGRAGIATFVMRGKEYLVAILSDDGILRAETMRFADEIRTPEDVGLTGTPEGGGEAVSRIERAIEDRAEEEISPEELEDRYAERLLERVDRKLEEEGEVRGGDVPEEGAAEAEETEVIDLMEVLKRRVKGEDTGRGDRGAAGAGEAEARELRERTRDELYERARELDIKGRSGMTKEELIGAIRRA